MTSSLRHQVTGLGLIVVTVLIWAGFAITTRYAGSGGTIAPADVALIRYLVPALFFGLFLPRYIRHPPKLRLGDCVAIAAGSGLPYFALAFWGGSLTSAAHVSAVLAGCLPLMMMLANLMRRDPAWLSARQKTGLLAIGGGVLLLVVGLGPVAGLLRSAAGVALLLGASLCWAFYTIGLRGVHGDPILGGILSNLPNALILLVSNGVGLTKSHLFASDPLMVATYVMLQGIGSGIVAGITYTLAIRHLGSVLASVYGALTPVLVVVISWPLLHETPSGLVLLGVAAIFGGVVTYNTAFRRRARSRA